LFRVKIYRSAFLLNNQHLLFNIPEENKLADIITKLNSRYRSLIEKINYIDYSNTSDADLKIAADILRKDIDDYLNDGNDDFNQNEPFIITAFSLVKEAVFRKLGIRAYDEQLWAALVLNDNSLVEMATGEGKTIAAVFSAFLNSLDFGAVHVFTFNDYLAKRDATMMKDVYEALGTTVGYISSGQSHERRKSAYNCHVTYMTVKECGFDYLREFMAEKTDDILLLDFNYAIVDEADSILIDESRIPLVIAGKTSKKHGIDLFEISQAVENLNINEHYEIDEYASNVFLTEDGIEKMEKLLNIENLYDESNMDLIVSVNNALFAKELVKKDIDYIVRNNSIELVDEFTGRIAEKRHWPHGLHEAIEAKEEIIPSEKGQILNQITLQNFIKMYPRLSGMTGTAASSAKEFDSTYNLKVHVIPTHNPMIRIDHPDILFSDKSTKTEYILKEIIKAHSLSRPVLIGTASVEESEELSALLAAKGVSCEVLNAKNDEKEASLIAKAGCSNQVTVSTNMAGRGIDIKLGGGDVFDHQRVVSLGGLLIIGTNRHESLRVDNQLRGRAGRQGDPGESKFIISIEDNIFKKYNFNELILGVNLNSKDGIITNKKIIKEASRLQKIVEGSNYDIRDSLLKYTVMLQEQSENLRKMRDKIFHMDNSSSLILEKTNPERYMDLCSNYTPDFVHFQERLLAMRVINQSWVDYLDNMSYIKDSIHILKMSGMDPLYEYNKILFESFTELKNNIEEQIATYAAEVEMTEEGFDFEKIGLVYPESTWTYVVSNTSEQLNLFPFLESLTKISKKKWFE